MEPNDIIEAILFKCVEARGYYQDIGVLADSVAGRVLPGLLNFSRLPLALPKLNIYLLHFGKYADRLLK